MRLLFWVIVSAGLFLSACSPQNQRTKGEHSILPTDLTSALKALLQKKDSKGSAGNPLAGVTRAQLKDIPGPLLFANLEKPNAYATLSLIGTNGGVRTFITADSVSLSLQDGIILASRGLGGDLMSADVSGTLAAIGNRGAKQYRRTLQWLDSQDQPQAVDYTCTMANGGVETLKILGTGFSTKHLRENCNSNAESYQNDYWVGTSKPVIWQSRQWLGNDSGYVTLQLWVK